MASPPVPVSFRVRAPSVTASESVWITGDAEALGSWNVARMVPMEREQASGDCFVTTVGLPLGQLVEYRYVVWRAGRIDRWESLLGNRKVYPGVRNVAQGRKAHQSSTYVAPGLPVPGPRTAATAVNGVVHGWSEHMCCHTEREREPWWEVDLGQEERVVCVQLWNRQDRMVDRIVPFHMMLAGTALPPGLADALSASAASHAFRKLTRRFRWDVEDAHGVPARVVRVQLERETYLHFAELQVFAAVDMRGETRVVAAETSTYGPPLPGFEGASCHHTVDDGELGVSLLDAREEEDGTAAPKMDSRWLTPHHGSELRILLGARSGIAPVRLFSGQRFTVTASVLGERPGACDVALLSPERLRQRVTVGAAAVAGVQTAAVATASASAAGTPEPPAARPGAAGVPVVPLRARLESEPLARFDPRTGSMTHPDSEDDSDGGAAGDAAEDGGAGSGSASGRSSVASSASSSGPDRGRAVHRHVPARLRDRSPRAAGDHSPRRDHIDQEGHEMEGMPSLRPNAETVNPLAAPLHGEDEGTPGGLAPGAAAAGDATPASLARAGPLPVTLGAAVDAWPPGEVQVFAVAWRKVKRGVRIDVHGEEEEGGSSTLLGSVPLLPSHFVSSRGVIHRPIVASCGPGQPVRIVGEFFGMFIVVSPIEHPQNTLETSSRILAPPRSMALDVGHRGLGRSFHQAPGYRKAAIRENTLMSFVTAGKLGADWVEFDVQLSRDRQCCVYHDFHILAAVRESATDHDDEIEVPVHELPLRQLQRCRIHHVPKKGRLFSRFLKRHQGKFVEELYRRAGARDGSAAATDEGPRARRTAPAGKATPRPKMAHLLEQVPTLRSLFEHVPAHVGFNVEIKYPCEDQHRALRPLAHFELNRYIDAILREVFDHAADRRIIFSCFDPDVCTMLRAKQPRYPVLFLTSGGTDIGYRDVRSQSLEAAVQFATSEGLQGIVTDSTPLLEDPSLVPVIKETGLLLFTYGDRNTSYDAVRIQKEAGVDAVISDNIGDLTKLAGKALDDDYSLRARDRDN